MNLISSPGTRTRALPAIFLLFVTWSIGVVVRYVSLQKVAGIPSASAWAPAQSESWRYSEKKKSEKKTTTSKMNAFHYLDVPANLPEST